MTRGLLLVISAPSGAGKSTLCQALVHKRPGTVLSVSCTTRAPRPGEKDGIDYFFMTTPAFKDGITQGRFLEWAEVHGQFYGTPKDVVERALVDGNDVALNIDTQGAESVRKFFPNDSVLIFIAPPTWGDLETRLRRRNQDSETVIQQRLANARGELRCAGRYDYLIVNDELDHAVDDLIAVVHAEHRRVSRRGHELARLEK